MQRLVLLLCALALSACGTTFGRAPWRGDIDECEQKAVRAPGLQTTQQRLAFVDRCMETKGWRATQGCRETQMEGSPAFCDYRR